MLEPTYYAENFLGNLDMKTLTMTFNLRFKGFCQGEGEEGNRDFFLFFFYNNTDIKKQRHLQMAECITYERQYESTVLSWYTEMEKKS